MVELRRGKMDLEQCRKALQSSNYFGTMLVQMGIADGLLGGATYSTADTIRPALQLVKTAPGQPLVSSCFLLVKGSEQYIMGDVLSISILHRMNWLRLLYRQPIQLVNSALNQK